MLLARKTEPNIYKPQIGFIKSAVLIDGGFSLKTADLLDVTIGRLESNYMGYDTSQTNSADNVYFKFDAVILTHWDTVSEHASEHFHDSKSLIRTVGSLSVSSRRNAIPLTCLIRERGFFNFLGLERLWTGTKFNHFKYNGDTPLTRLYCQSWPGKLRHISNPQGYGFSGTASLLAPSKISTPFTCTAFIGKGKPRAAKPNCLILYATTDLLIGVNVFTGNSLSTLSWEEVENPLQLVNDNDPWKTNDANITWTDAPGLYIVGVNKMLLGDNTLPGATFHVKGMVGIINKPKAKEDVNPDSVLSLLIWKNKDNTKDPKISLYTGGDTEYAAEDKVAKFIGLSSQILVVKAGHHGSAAGTSINFLKVAKPEHYLVSAGTDHGHPGISIQRMT